MAMSVAENEFDPVGAGFYIRVGPYMGPGAMAYRYECVDCDFSLVTVAESDLTPENREILERHSCTHIVGRQDTDA